MNTAVCEGLGGRLQAHYPLLDARTGSNDPAGRDLVVNATPMGMNAGDALPMDMARIAPGTFVGEVVMRAEVTAFLAAAQARGCPVQVGSDMLFEQIPAYLEFFGFPTTTPDVLRSLARLSYRPGSGPVLQQRLRTGPRCDVVAATPGGQQKTSSPLH